MASNAVLGTIQQDLPNPNPNMVLGTIRQDVPNPNPNVVLGTIQQNLQLFADDIDLTGAGNGIQVGAGVLWISPTSARAIGVGAAAGQMVIDKMELRAITARGLVIGSDTVTSFVTVSNVTTEDCVTLTAL